MTWLMKVASQYTTRSQSMFEGQLSAISSLWRTGELALLRSKKRILFFPLFFYVLVSNY